MTATDGWSYTSLRRRYGEDAALAMLQHQRGYGQFAAAMHSEGAKIREEERCLICDTLIVGNTACPVCK